MNVDVRESGPGEPKGLTIENISEEGSEKMHVDVVEEDSEHVSTMQVEDQASDPSDFPTTLPGKTVPSVKLTTTSEAPVELPQSHGDDVNSATNPTIPPVSTEHCNTSSTPKFRQMPFDEWNEDDLTRDGQSDPQNSSEVSSDVKKRKRVKTNSFDFFDNVQRKFKRIKINE